MKARTRNESAVRPKNLLPPAETDEHAPPNPATGRSLTPWVFAGFLITYVPFLLVPVFLNNQHVMKEICPVFRIEGAGIGMDLREILEFSHSWFIEHKTPYIKSNSYPPLETLFFVPLLYLNFNTAHILITAINFACYLLLTLALPVLFSRQRQLSPLIILFVATGLFSHGFIFEVERGQFNVIAMLFCLLGIYLFHFHRRWRIPAYVLFSLSIQLKVFPAIFILLLVDNWRDWKAILKRFAMLAAANFLCLFVLGPTAFREFFATTWAKMNNPHLWVGNHSITCYSSFMEQFFSIPAKLLSPALLVLLLLMLSTILVFSYLRKVEGFNPYLLVGCTVCALLIPAVSHDYALSFLAAPVATFLSLVRPSEAGTPVNRISQKVAILMISFAYFSTVFSVFNKPAPTFLFSMATPMLILILLATVVLFVMDKENERHPGL